MGLEDSSIASVIILPTDNTLNHQLINCLLTVLAKQQVKNLRSSDKHQDSHSGVFGVTA